MSTGSSAHNNGVARTPPMGWNTFEAFVGEYDDAILRGNVNALVDSGLKNLGYVYFNLDGGWWAYKGALRDAGGNINFNLTAATCENDPPCPVYANGKAGMKEFADFVRSKGMKFGLYMQPTEQLNTCTHLTEDVNLLKYLGVEFLKYDGYITRHRASRKCATCSTQAAYRWCTV